MNLQLRMYQQNQVRHEVEQATPVQLVLLLYDRLVALLQQSLVRMEEGNMARKGEALLKASDILSELKAVLNKEEGGEIAEKLDALYLFAIQQITEGNFRNDPKPIEVVLQLIEELREGWRGVERLVKTNTDSSPVAM